MLDAQTRILHFLQQLALSINEIAATLATKLSAQSSEVNSSTDGKGYIHGLPYLKSRNPTRGYRP